jgi:signal transduction histidine kinase
MSGAGHPRVLFIEGSADLRARVRSILEADGIDLEEASDAAEGAELAQARHPDLVLLDDDVRDFDRGAAVRRLRGALEPMHTPLVVHGPSRDRDDCLSAGCDGFFDEPLESSRLPAVLRAYLAGQRDAREADRLQRELARVSAERDRYKEQLRRRNEFLRNLAHELATPLTPLVGYLRLLRSGRLGTLSDKQQHVIEAMIHATERLGRSIDNLVDYASLETGGYRIHASEFDAGPLLDAIVEEFRARARDKHLRLDVQQPTHLKVQGDERRIRQAISNLLDNAVRASPHGGHVLVHVSGVGDRIQFSVYDQGPGVPLEVRQHHDLDPVLRGADATGGAGLGLPVTLQIAEAHGGAFILESPPREQPDVRDVFPGSRVGFWIPRQRPAA